MKFDAKLKNLASCILGIGYVCDFCLGRQFAKLAKNKSNDEIGALIREILVTDFEKGKIKTDPSNFKNMNVERPAEYPRCSICNNLLENLGKFLEGPVCELKKMDFKSFIVGVKMSDELVMKEESLWEKIGIKYCEPIKSEISRELSKMITRSTRKKLDQNKPDIIVTIDVQRNSVDIFSGPVFFYGAYKKFTRGLPQTSSSRYKQTVEDIIAKPLIKFTSGSSHVFHAQGREDMGARCLAWRPFVMEIKQPKKRRIDLKKVKMEINKSTKVKVDRLRYSDRREIASVKSKNPYKVYRLIVSFEMPVERISDLKNLVGKIKQSTPSRVLGMKPDKTKHKKVKSIKWKRINTKTYQFEISAESGLYLHELVTGDGGRTKPSISGILANRAKLKEFDLIGLRE